MALVLVPKMRAGIPPSGRGARLGHVLHHQVARFESSNQKRPLIADQWSDPITLTRRVSRGAGAAFLSEPEMPAADNFLLFEEIFERLLHLAVEQHVAINLDALRSEER